MGFKRNHDFDPQRFRLPVYFAYLSSGRAPDLQKLQEETFTVFNPNVRLQNQVGIHQPMLAAMPPTLEKSQSFPYQYAPHKAVAEVSKIADYRRLVAVNHGSKKKPTDGSKSGWRQRKVVFVFEGS